MLLIGHPSAQRPPSCPGPTFEETVRIVVNFSQNPGIIKNVENVGKRRPRAQEGGRE